MPATLILILGDQLSREISALRGPTKDASVIVMAELAEEATYVRHHKKKLAFIFTAMRHFAAELEHAGWSVDYAKLGDEDAPASFGEALERAVAKHQPDKIRVTEAGEHRVAAMMAGWEGALGLPVEITPDDRFIASHDEFEAWASGRKQLRMEYFYREMRRKTGLLMDGDEPEGGAWNYDAENRKPAKPDLFTPKPFRVEPDEITRDVLVLVADRFPDHIGTLEPFRFGATRADAERALGHFIENALPGFGDYQDAMLTDEPFLHHSLLSLYLNIGLLDPLKVCQRVESAYRAGDAPLNAAEGFIRQIIGWREFVRGVYWRAGPEYTASNALGADRPLPGFYWTGETDMACLAQAIGQTIEEAYAHHIQRLMVTGNFAMLIGADPHQVHEWYLEVYADAYEWVEAPNTIGMSQFADGGLLGSKPYAAGGAYINRMSDYCAGCAYKVSKKTGEDACPFNYLYWDFLARNEGALKGNHRLGPVYRTWEKMDADKKRAYRASAKAFLARLA